MNFPINNIFNYFQHEISNLETLQTASGDQALENIAYEPEKPNAESKWEKEKKQFAEKIETIKSDRVKAALLRQDPHAQCSKKRDGIDVTTYKELNLWDKVLPPEKNPLFKGQIDFWISSLWKESDAYFKHSLDYMLSKNESTAKFLPSLLLWAGQSEGAEQKQTKFINFIIEKLENHSSVYGGFLKKTLIKQASKPKKDLTEQLNIIFKYTGQSKILREIALDLLLQMKNDLPYDIKQLHLGNWKVEECIEGMEKEDPVFISMLPKSVRIRNHVLKKLGIRPKIDMWITEKELAQVLGDSYISGSHLEGYVLENAISLLLQFEQALGDTLAARLKGILHLEDYPAWRDKQGKFEMIVEELKTDRKVACCAGWCTNDGGHAMIAEAFLNADSPGTASVRLYNEGAGIEYHRMHSQPFRERRDAYLEKAGIPERLVLSPVFWMILVGMQHSNTQTKEPFEADDLYRWFIDVIPGKLAKASVQILPHRSGTCTFKSLLAFLKTHMSEQDYDLFILKLKFGLLVRYEEDLPYRCTDVALEQRTLLRELRNKLILSVRLQAEVGRISDELADLLVEYCLVDLEQKEKSGNSGAAVQLTGMFTLINPPRNNRRNKKYIAYKDSLFAGSKPAKTSKEVIALLDHLKIHWNFHPASYYISSIYYGNIQSKPSFFDEELTQSPHFLFAIQDWISLMPSLNDLEEMFKNDPDPLVNGSIDYLILIREIIKVLDVIPSQKGAPNALLHAWLMAFADIWAKRYLQEVGGVDLFTAIPFGSHPLELYESPLYCFKETLNIIAEGILTDWIRYRVRIKDVERSFTITKYLHVNQQGKESCNYIIDQPGSSVDMEFYQKWKKLFDLDDADIERKQTPDPVSLIKAIIKCPSSKSIEKSISQNNCDEYKKPFLAYTILVSDRILAELDWLISQSRKNSDLTFEKRNGKGVYQKWKEEQTLADANPTPEIYPFIGIEQTLEKMEEDPHCIPLHKPNISWIQPCLIGQFDGIKHRIPIKELTHEWIVLTPLHILLQSKALTSDVFQRLKTLCEKMIANSNLRFNLCAPLLDLLAKINLRAPSDHAIEIDIGIIEKEKLQQLFESSLGEWLARYFLSLPKKEEIQHLQLFSFYYLKILYGKRQDETFLSLSREFTGLWQAGDFGTENEREQQKKQAFDRVYPSPKWNIVVSEDGTPAIDDVLQVDSDWNNSACASTLRKIFGNFSFGPWMPYSIPFQEETRIARIWEDPENGFFIAEQQGKPVLCNGLVLKERLRFLGLKKPKGIGNEIIYEIRSSKWVKGIPDSFKKASIEYWHPIVDKKDLLEKGTAVIVDPKRCKHYVVKSQKRTKENKRKIFDGVSNAQLLTGVLCGKGRLFVKWCKQKIQIPHLGHSNVPLEIWARGRGKALKIWLNCMDGRFKFNITKNKEGSFQYISEDCEGFLWEPFDKVAELGGQGGILLNKEDEQILVLSEQILENETKNRDSKTHFKEKHHFVWQTVENGTHFVLSRKLHPSFDRNDPRQTLFACASPEVYSQIIQELFQQRLWERARAYAALIPVNSLTEASAKWLRPLFAPLQLDHPKARVIRLMLLVRCAGGEDISQIKKLNYTRSRLEHEYKKYIEGYHWLNDGWALCLSEEHAISQWLDPDNTDPMIQSHLTRAEPSDEERMEIEEEQRPLTAPSSSRMEEELIPKKVPKNTRETNQNVLLYNLFRPPYQNVVFTGAIKALTKPEKNLHNRLIQAALIWYSAYDIPEWQNCLAPLLQRLLDAEAKANGGDETGSFLNFTNQLSCFIKNSEVIEIEEALNLSEDLKKQVHALSQELPLDESDSLISQDPMDMEEEDTRSARQIKRQEKLNKKVLGHDQIAASVGRKIQETDASKLKSKNEAMQSVRSVKRRRIENTDFPNERFDVDALLAEKDLKSELKRLHTTLSAQQKERLKYIKKFYTDTSSNVCEIGLRELFIWLNSLDAKPKDPTKRQVAKALVNFAQCSAELRILEKAVRIMDSDEKEKQAVFRRVLRCSSISTFSMPDPLRYRLAAFIWRRQIALRPKQLAAVYHSEDGNGSLQQLDCGDGKSAVISPAICNRSDTLIFNIVPAGNAKEHARLLSQDSSTSKGALTPLLRTSRSEINSIIPLIRKKMEDAAKRRVPMVATVSDIASLFLRYYEMLFKRESGPLYEELEEILKIFKNQGTLLLDEIDAAAKEQIHWTLLDRQKHLDLNTIRKTGLLYQSMYTIDFHQKEELFCLSGKGGRFSAERYWKEGIVLLVDLLLKNHLWQSIAKEVGKEWMKSYLLHKRGEKGWDNLNKKFKEIKNKEMAEYLQWFRAQLHVYLPHTLKLRFKVHYGPGNNAGEVAVPYQSAHFPDPKSQYTNIHILSNLTVQWMLQSSPSKEELRNLINIVLKQKTLREYAKRWLGPDGSAADLMTIRDNEQGCQRLIQKLVNQPLVRLDISLLLKLPQVKYYDLVLSFTMAALTASMNRVIGLTATPYNSAGMDERLAENFIPSDANETSRQLFLECEIQVLPEISEEMIRSFFSREKVHALIDPNALLVDYQNDEIAKFLIEGARKSLNFVVYWDFKENALMAMDKNGRSAPYEASRHRSENCGFFYDQTRSRGTDLPLPKRCTAEVFIGKECTFTEKKQAAERCRWLKDGLQTVRFWVEEMDNPTPVLMLDRSFSNEKVRLKDELVIMAKREMEQLCTQKLLYRIWQNPSQKIELLKKFHSLLLHRIDHQMYRELASLEPLPSIKEDLEMYSKNLIEKYLELLEDKDKKSIEGYSARVISALEESANSTSHSAIDIKAEAVSLAARTTSTSASHQSKTRSQRVQSDIETLWMKKGKLPSWNPAIVFSYLKQTGLNCRDKKVIHSFTQETPYPLKFVLKRLSLDIPFIGSEKVWTFSPPQSLKNQPKSGQQSTSQNSNSKPQTVPNIKIQWNRKLSFILEAPSNDGESLLIDKKQYIALSDSEGDYVAQHLLNKGQFYQRQVVPLRLFQSDGSMVAGAQDKEAQQIARPPNDVLAAIAVFNGSLGKLDSSVLTALSWEGEIGSMRLAFLKKRIISNNKFLGRSAIQANKLFFDAALKLTEKGEEVKIPSKKKQRIN